MREPTSESSDNPRGIDYERWTQLVNPAPREAFADPLDLEDVLLVVWIGFDCTPTSRSSPS